MKTIDAFKAETFDTYTEEQRGQILLALKEIIETKDLVQFNNKMEEKEIEFRLDTNEIESVLKTISFSHVVSLITKAITNDYQKRASLESSNRPHNKL